MEKINDLLGHDYEALSRDEMLKRLKRRSFDLSSVPSRHQWHLSFDRVTCRACGAHFTDQDADEHCAGAEKTRPMAGFRQQQQEGRA